MVAARSSSGAACEISYDLPAGLTTVTGGDGAVRRHRWDRQQQVTRDDDGLLTRLIDPAGHATLYRYDDAGNLVEEEDPAGHVRATEWLAHRALPASITDADGGVTRLAYDAHHGLAAVTDATGKRHHFRHDACGRLVTTRNPEGGEVRREYDAQGRLAALVNENGARHLFRWRPGGLPESETAPDGVTTAYRHDAAGRLVSRALSAEGATPLAEEYEYDARGLLAARHTADGVTRFEHSPGGRLLRAVTHPHGGGPQALGLELEYDRCGRTGRCARSMTTTRTRGAAGNTTARGGCWPRAAGWRSTSAGGGTRRPTRSTPARRRLPTTGSHS